MRAGDAKGPKRVMHLGIAAVTALALVLGAVVAALLVLVGEGDERGAGSARGDDVLSPGVRPPSPLQGGEAAGEAAPEPARGAAAG